jgi:hypothetical protein
VASTVLKASGGGDPFAEPNRKAFARLAAQRKQQYPRLPLCLTADGLYPYQGLFAICRDSGWVFILTFKDGNLPTVWEDVPGLLPLTPAQCRHERRYHGSTVIEQRFRWVNHLAYPLCQDSCRLTQIPSV